MRQPPRQAGAPLFGPSTWRRALGQGLVLTLAVLLLAFWPHSPVELRRSLVFSLLLLAGGGLVWLNGPLASRHTLAGAAIGAGLWLLLLALPRLQAVLSLAPLPPTGIAVVLLTTAVALLLADRLTRPARPV
ncbi:MAG: hypothetical protein RLZZ423_1823, partial [Cyanobacteriota bacterium]